MIIKCKMCGGDLKPEENSQVCECEFCGTKQTVPTADNEKKMNLFNRANRLRMAAEFDKAATVYTSITAEFPEEAEAYWGLCLCKFGIEYVDDPATGKKIPTCHRTMTESILDDSDFDQACENADATARRVYREEAKEIDRLQRGILEIVEKEDPYDVFICYKETGEDGGRTEDSVLAQDIYESLIARGLKAFFARISLEDKLGQDYEPYIYAALHSARVMLVVGTDYEYFDAVWVKNEWARFLDMMKSNREKTLIPCYKGIDAYDMPREFKNLQGQDMGKLGWLQDLTRGVMKLCGKDEAIREKKPEAPEKVVVQNYGPNISAILDRGFLLLEDGSIGEAQDIFKTVFNTDSRNAEAYLGLCMADLGYVTRDEIRESYIRDKKERSKIITNNNFKRSKQFASGEFQIWLSKMETDAAACDEEKTRAERAVKDENEYRKAAKHQLFERYTEAREIYKRLGDYKDSSVQYKLCQVCIEKKDYIESIIKKNNKRLSKIKNVEKQIRQKEDFLKEVEAQKSIYEKRMKVAKDDIQRNKGFFARNQRNRLEETVSHCLDEINLQEKKIEELLLELESIRETKKDLLEEEPYLKAVNACMEAGYYYSAYNILKSMQNSKKAEILLQEEKMTQLEQSLAYRQIGNIVKFGRYEQGNYTNNGEEEIEWIVLDVQDGKSLLLSRYGLDAKPYNTESTNITWEKCTLRKWLNEDFLKAAFSEKEQLAILLSNVDNGKAQGYSGWSTDGGYNTQDYLFLLSYAESNKYLGVKYGDFYQKSRVAPTAWAKTQGASTDYRFKTADGEPAGWYWLRSPGHIQDNAAYVNPAGSLISNNVSDNNEAVRPAFWMNLEFGIF